jgi:hypothetical protein
VIDAIAQAWIVLFSFGASYLVSRTDKWHRWGHVAGLIGQPAFIYTTWHHEQWGMFFLTWWYLWNWYRGARRRFST